MNKIVNFILNILICISAFFFTTFISNGNYFNIYIEIVGAILSLIINTYIINKYIRIDICNIKLKYLLSSIGLTLYFIYNYFPFAKFNFELFINELTEIYSLNLNFNLLLTIFGFLSIPYLCYLSYLFLTKILNKIICFFKNMTQIEKRYLIIITIISTLAVTLINTKTNVFYKPTYQDTLIYYDAIYVTDSGILTEKDAYFDINNNENDLRHPLFGLFALPFSMTAKIISNCLFFVPINNLYEIILTITQFILSSISVILIARILKLEEKEKIFFYTLYSSTYTFLAFNLILEQYVTALFYLILAIYSYFNNKEKINYLYIGAIGTFITSVIIFPCITKFKSLKDWLKKSIKCFIVFLGTMITWGQLQHILFAYQKYMYLSEWFLKSIPFKTKLYEFTHFIKNIFIAPSGQMIFIEKNEYHIRLIENSPFSNLITDIRDNIRYYQIPNYNVNTTTCLSIIGIILFGIILASIIINWKKSIVKISTLWVTFSIILLLIIGWDANELSFILYITYFGWAYIILFYELIKKIFNRTTLNIVILTISFILFTLNIIEIINIISFGTTYYLI